MKRIFSLIPILLILVVTQNGQTSSKRILIFAGAASKPPTEEVVKIFHEKTGIPVDILFGGSGFVLTQMKLAKKGDLYFPGSSDFMELAKKEGLVFSETERHVASPSLIHLSEGNISFPKNGGQKGWRR